MVGRTTSLLIRLSGVCFCRVEKGGMIRTRRAVVKKTFPRGSGGQRAEKMCRIVVVRTTVIVVIAVMVIVVVIVVVIMIAAIITRIIMVVAVMHVVDPKTENTIKEEMREVRERSLGDTRKSQKSEKDNAHIDQFERDR